MIVIKGNELDLTLEQLFDWAKEETYRKVEVNIKNGEISIWVYDFQAGTGIFIEKQEDWETLDLHSRFMEEEYKKYQKLKGMFEKIDCND